MSNRCSHDRDCFMLCLPEHPPQRQLRVKNNLLKHVRESATKPKAYERVTHYFFRETGERRRQGRSEGRDRNCFLGQYVAHHVDYEKGFMGTWDGEKIIPFTKAELIADIQASNPRLLKRRIEHSIDDAIERRMAEWTTVTIPDENGYKKKITTLRLLDEFYRVYKSIGDIYARRVWVNQQERHKKDNQEKRGFTRSRDQQLVAHNLKGPAKPGDHELIARINKEVPDRQDRVRIAKWIDGLNSPQTRQVTLKRFSDPQLIGAIIDRCLHPATGPP